MYDNDQGALQSYKEASWWYWYRRAADQGHADAQCDLGAMYDNDQSVVLSDRGVWTWHRKAADQGHANVQ